jgi:hypothetical protein
MLIQVNRGEECRVFDKDLGQWNYVAIPEAIIPEVA